jgi:hypothetical protein
MEYFAMRRTLLCLVVLLAAATSLAQTTVGPTTSLPVYTTGSTKIVVQYINPFRFQYSTQVTSTNVNAPTLSAIAPAASTAVELPQLAAKAEPAVVAAPTLAELWTATGTDLSNARTLMLALQQQIEQATANAGAEQACYKIRLQYYSSWRLDLKHKSDLIAFAKANATPVAASSAPNLGDPTAACAISSDDGWPLNLYRNAESAIFLVQSDMQKMTFDAGFAAWDINGQKAAYDAVTAAVTALSTQFQTYAPGSNTANSFVASVSADAAERNLLTPIAAAANISAAAVDVLFQYPVNVDCKTNWYGRGRTDVVNLHYLDISIATPTDTAIQISSSSCLTPGTISTGIGMSFLHNTEYNFVSGIDPTNPGNTISVIGTTTDQPVTPIYALQYNIGLKDWHNGLGMQATVGAAMGSSSGTAIIEPISGLSISLMHRAFFISPVLQIGRRESLLPGYYVGFPQGNGLTTVPTNTSWKPGFGLTFTFAVAQ